MYNFDPYNVFLTIAENITCATCDWFCGPGFWISLNEFKMQKITIY